MAKQKEKRSLQHERRRKLETFTHLLLRLSIRSLLVHLQQIRLRRIVARLLEVMEFLQLSGLRAHYVVLTKSYRGERQSNASDASDKELAEAVKDVHPRTERQSGCWSCVVFFFLPPFFPSHFIQSDQIMKMLDDAEQNNISDIACLGPTRTWEDFRSTTRKRSKAKYFQDT